MKSSDRRARDEARKEPDFSEPPLNTGPPAWVRVVAVVALLALFLSILIGSLL